MAEQIVGTIASQVETDISGIDGTRKSKDSEWSEITVPPDFAINKNLTNVEVVNEQGSEHTCNIVYANEVEIVPDTNIFMPTTIKVQTHARSSKGSLGGKGAMAVKVHYTYVKYR